MRRCKRRLRAIGLYRFLLRDVMARPLYRAARLGLPVSAKRAVEASRLLLPTYRPLGELAPYVGEALLELRHGADVVLNVAPTACMVASMGEVLTPGILQRKGSQTGRIQTLTSGQGDVDEEALTLAVLKAMGPRRFYGVSSRRVSGPDGTQVTV
jgi:predicted nucleotide-binding protein (sugar kinase/HSP70/actin superfamily)